MLIFWTQISNTRRKYNYVNIYETEKIETDQKSK